MATTLPTAFSPSCLPAGFDLKADGVYNTEGENDKRLTSVRAWVSATTRNLNAGDWSIVVSWEDPDGMIKASILPYESLSPRGSVIEGLIRDGLLVIPGSIGQFLRYLSLAAALPGIPRIRTHRHLGFFKVERGGILGVLGFMLPSDCLFPATLEQPDATDTENEPPEPVRFHPLVESKVFDAYAPAGSLADWQAGILAMRQNKLLVFAVSLGFAAPFLGVSGLDVVIFHLYGNSSSGKTTALQGFVSPWGNGSDPQTAGMVNSLIERWNSTANAIEPIAAVHSGMCLAIDELGSSGNSLVSVYNFTSGRGKSRMDSAGGLRDQHRWTLCTLSSGEYSMQEKIETSTKRKAKTGEIIRAMDIPVAELAHDDCLTQDEERRQIEAFKKICSESYGTAGPAFIQAVLDHFKTEDALCDWLQSALAEFHDRFVREANERGQKLGPAHVRAMRRFAFVAAVGTLACQTAILPFSEDEVIDAVAAVSEAWLTGLPALSEGERALGSLRNYVIRNVAQILNFEAWSAGGCVLSQVPRDMRAIQKRGLLLFTPEQFAQACGGHSVKEALKYLREQGYLKGEGTKSTYRVDIAELNFERLRCHAIHVKRLLSGSDLALVKGGLAEVEQSEPDDADDTDASPPIAFPTKCVNENGPRKNPPPDNFGDDDDDLNRLLG